MGLDFRLDEYFKLEHRTVNEWMRRNHQWESSYKMNIHACMSGMETGRERERTSVGWQVRKK